MPRKRLLLVIVSVVALALTFPSPANAAINLPSGVPDLPGLGSSLIDIFKSSLPNWVTDPLGYLRDEILDGYQGLGKYIERWVVDPPKAIHGKWQDNAFANSLGLTFALLSVVGVVTLVATAVWPRFAGRFVKTAVLLVVVAALYPVWFSIGGYLAASMGQVIHTLADHRKGHQSFIFLPEIHNPLLAIFAMIALGVLGGLLLLIFFAYEILFVVTLITGLPMLALSPLSDWFKYKFQQIFSLMIVTSFFGRLLAVASLSLGVLTVRHMPEANTRLGAFLTLVAILGLALYSQYWVLKQADQIYGNVTGRTLGTQKITNVVQARIRKQHDDPDAELHRILAAHAQQLSAEPIASPVPATNGAAQAQRLNPEPVPTPNAPDPRIQMPTNSDNGDTTWRR